MRPSYAAGLAALLLGGAGCAIPLDGASSDAGASSPAAAPLGGCLLFASPGAVLLGPGRSLGTGAGGALWLFPGTTSSGGQPVGASVQASGARPGCYAGAALGPIVDSSGLGPGELVTPLDLVTTDQGLFLYFSLARLSATDAFGVHVEGTGVAPYDAARGLFVPTDALLFTADRPPYGSAAVVVGGQVFAYGCQSSGLDAACYLAEAPADELTDPGAYTFSTGSGHSSTDPDDAAPLIHASTSLSVRPDAAGGRLLLTYAPELGSTLAIRSALSPDGPFSEERSLGACELPDDPDYFCTGGAQHPEIQGAPGTLALSYSPATLTAGKPALPPRLAVVTLPADLP